MFKPNHSEITSIVAAMSSIGASLTLEQAGVAIGIITALVTCVVNALYTIRKDLREQRQADSQLRTRPKQE